MGISLPHDSAILLWAYTQRTLYSTTRTIAHINWDFILNIHKLETTKITLKRSKNKEIVIHWNNQTQMKFPNNGKGRSWLPISYHQIKFSILGVSYIQLSFWQRSPKEISKYLTVAKKKGWYSQTHSHTKKVQLLKAVLTQLFEHGEVSWCQHGTFIFKFLSLWCRKVFYRLRNQKHQSSVLPTSYVRAIMATNSEE